MDVLITLQHDESGVERVAAALASGACTLVVIVESLESLLVDTDASRRCAGVTYLARVMNQLPADRLTADECTFMAEFVTDRSRDHFAVMPAVVRCVAALVRQRCASDTAVQRLVRCLYSEAHTQSLMLLDRLAVFGVFERVLAARPAAVAELGADFVTGFVQSVEGEREPRCLLVVLRAARALLVLLTGRGSCQLSPVLVDELFDILSCYFPVDFTPPPSSASDGGGGVPHGITRQVLADSLSACLTATAVFSGRLVALALDKLESPVEEARGDAVDLLLRCCRHWPPSETRAALLTASPSSPTTPSSSSATGRLCSTVTRAALYQLLSVSQLAQLLQLVSAVSRLLLPAVPHQQPAVVTAAAAAAAVGGGGDEEAVGDDAQDETWFGPLVTQCLHLMCQPESTELMRPAADLLCAAAAGGATCCRRVLPPVLAALCDRLEQSAAANTSDNWSRAEEEQQQRQGTSEEAADGEQRRSQVHQWRVAVIHCVAALLRVADARQCVSPQLAERLVNLAATLPSTATTQPGQQQQQQQLGQLETRQLVLAAFAVLTSAAWLLTEPNGEQSASLVRMSHTCHQLQCLFLDSSDRSLVSQLAESAVSQCVSALYRAAPTPVTDTLLRHQLDQLLHSDASCPLSERRLQLVLACAVDVAAVRVTVPLLLVRLVRAGRTCTDTCLQTLDTLYRLVDQVCTPPLPPSTTTARAAATVSPSSSTTASVRQAAVTCLLDQLQLVDKLLELVAAAAREVQFDRSRLQVVEATAAVSLPLHHTAVLVAVARLLCLLCRSAEGAVAAQLVNAAVSLFLQLDDDDNGDDQDSSAGAGGAGKSGRLAALFGKWRRHLAPLVHHSPWQHTQLVILLAGIVGGANFSHVTGEDGVGGGGVTASGDGCVAATVADATAGRQQQESTASAAEAGRDESDCAVLQHLAVLVNLLTRLALKQPHAPSAEWACRLLAVLFNKLPPRLPLATRLLHQITDQCEFVWAGQQRDSSAVSGASDVEQVLLPVLRLWRWLTRGAVLAARPEALHCVRRLVEWLQEPAATVAPLVADAIGQLACDDSDWLLTRANHCRVRLLYHQWLFSTVWRLFNDNDDDSVGGGGGGGGGGICDAASADADTAGSLSPVNSLRLSVLSSLLTALSPAAVEPYIPQLVAPLAAGLQLLLLPPSAAPSSPAAAAVPAAHSASTGSSSGDGSCKTISASAAAATAAGGVGVTCLKLLAQTADQRPQLLEQHVDTLVPRLLKIATHAPASAPAVPAATLTVRAEALRCVARLSALTTHRVLPMRTAVLDQLRPCLADRKRLVRQQAVLASNAWYLVGQPGGGGGATSSATAVST